MKEVLYTTGQGQGVTEPVIGDRDGGLSTGGKVALGVCIPLTVILIGAVAFYYFRAR